ncbi:MAG: hypothetical protein SFT93_05760 [Rickettsiaceae bacterium]|nr:hypothetical protein [Rickettsiaceae bacterium]
MKFFKEIIKSFNRRLDNKKLYFHISDHGLTVLYYINNKFNESYYSPLDSLASDHGLVEFVLKRKTTTAKIILNSANMSLEHVALPAFGSFNRIDPIENYCLTRFEENQIYQAKVYSIFKDNTEVWKAVICSISLNEVVNFCLAILKNCKIPLFGIYFYDLTAQDVAISIAKDNKINLENYIYTTVSVIDSKEILITLNHQGSLLSTKRFTYPKTESDKFILGTIEHYLSDLWHEHKDMVIQEHFSKANIFFISGNLKRLIKSTSLKTVVNLFTEDNDENSIKTFIHHFSLGKRPAATSRELRSYKMYRQINSMIFKPIYLIIFVIFSYFIYVKLCVNVKIHKISELNKTYEKLSGAITKKSADYPEIKNVVQLADLYNLKKRLTQNLPVPFPLIHNFIKTCENKLDIANIDWEIKADCLSSFNLTLEVNIDKARKEEQFKSLDQIIAKLKEEYGYLKIQYQRCNSSGSQESSNSIKLKIIISGDLV